MIEALKQLVEELNERWRIASLKHINQANMHALGEAHAYNYITSRLRKIIQRGGWISVEERLPEYTGEVIIVIVDSLGLLRVKWAYYNNENRNFSLQSGLLIKPTHWMPLPEPPEEQQRGDVG